MATELQTWLETQGEVVTADLKVPPEIIRYMLAQSVITNWPRYEVEYNEDGDPFVLKFGSPHAANKALEMLAKDAGMLAEKLDVSGKIELVINGIDIDDLR